jgi:2-polyprenyl-3-methyl-5-hydroxy-6-metoxy-1,4-benzoquinol methylase
VTIYDIGLFESLNEEYRDLAIRHGGVLFPSRHNIVYDPYSSLLDVKKLRKSRLENMRKILERIDISCSSRENNLDVRGNTERGRLGSKLREFLRDIDVAGKDVVEIGCGHGWVSDAMARYCEAKKVIGLDVRDYPWGKHQNPSVTLIKADLSQGNILPNASADVVASFVVMEHVSRPIQMLRAIFDVLRPGGTAWLRFNLYRGWNASHRASGSEIVFFPWPHLLFQSEICKEYFKKHAGVSRGFAWVNKMTISEYINASVEIGFNIEHVDLIQSPIDAKFYLRFESELGKYPALDLSTPFMKLILKKPTSPGPGVIPVIGYQAAQSELDIRLAELR